MIDDRATCARPDFRYGDKPYTLTLETSSGRHATCRVNDRGPASSTGRIVDVSPVVCRELRFCNEGVVKVWLYRKVKTNSGH